MILCNMVCSFQKRWCHRIQATLASTNVTEKSAFWAFKYSPLTIQTEKPRAQNAPKTHNNVFLVL
uniref:Uncharacterized protein n=1 Tax=Anguilla anguilla TaxID=7936 RepID=A0A0E9TFN5_ANGAN